jgi:hypothetical protein
VTQQINLFNPIFRKQKKYFSSVTMVQALAIICVACGLLAADAAIRLRSLTAQAAETDAMLAARQQRLTEVRVQYAPRQKSSTLGAEIIAEQATLTTLQNASAKIRRGGFGDSTGFSPYFRALARQRIDGLWLTHVDLAAGGSAIGIKGNALQAPLVPQYMARLAQEPVMKGKAFSTLAMDAVLPPSTERRDGSAAPAGAPVAARTPVYLRFSLQSVAASAASPKVAP